MTFSVASEYRRGSDIFCMNAASLGWRPYSFHLVAYVSNRQAQWRGKMESERAERGVEHTFCLKKSRRRRDEETTMVAKGKESLKQEIIEGPDLPPRSSRAVKWDISRTVNHFLWSLFSTDKMIININHVCVTLSVEHKPYCNLNEPWLCWAGLTNGVRLRVGDPEKRLETLYWLTAFTVDNFVF